MLLCHYFQYDKKQSITQSTKKIVQSSGKSCDATQGRNQDILKARG